MLWHTGKGGKEEAHSQPMENHLFTSRLKCSRLLHFSLSNSFTAQSSLPDPASSAPTKPGEGRLRGMVTDLRGCEEVKPRERNIPHSNVPDSASWNHDAGKQQQNALEKPITARKFQSLKSCCKRISQGFKSQGFIQSHKAMVWAKPQSVNSIAWIQRQSLKTNHLQRRPRGNRSKEL